ncbi:MAG: Bug family tripartite tricarboxylate transporter substrate binding protein [Rubrivivax sp.]
MKIIKALLLTSMVSAGLLTGVGASAQSSAMPTKPVRLVIPFPPGGGPDIAARAMSNVLAPLLGQPIVIDSKTGAGGIIGIQAALDSKDGHTLLMASTGIVIQPSLNPAVKYDVTRDFDAVGWVSAFPGVLVVPARSTAQTVADLLADMKARPGKVSCGNGGIGTVQHLGLELFLGITGTSCNGIPYRGEGAMAPALLAGDIDMAFSNLPGVLPHIRSGRVRALALAANEPVPELPGVPTLRSLGYPQMDVQGWVVVLAPKGMAPERLELFDSALQKALSDENVRKTLIAAGLTPVIGGRTKLEAYLKSEGEKWGNVVRSRGIKAD